jgi:hypothetical protein
VEFVNFVLALAIMAAAWTFVVQTLAYVDRHSGSGRHAHRPR